MALDPGVIVHDRYRIISLLGAGGMGAVDRAFDQRLSRQVAIKENYQSSPQATGQFLREATLLASLRHPNLPVVFDNFILDNQGHYLVMEYIEGEDLQEKINRLGALPESDAVHWIDQVASALDYLHRQSPPIIHRDVKPGNIKITPAGEAILVDFGIAKQYSDDQRTQTGAQAVTPGYSPPEQYGGASTDARSDVFALAATLNALLTGAPPANSLDRLISKKVLVPPISLNPQLSKHVSAAIVKALELKPEDRYATMAEFRQAIQRQPAPSTQILAPPTAARSEVPTVFRPQAAFELPVPPPNARKRRGWLWVGAIGVPLVLIVVAGAAFALMSGTVNISGLLAGVAPAATASAPPPPTAPPPTLTRPPEQPSATAPAVVVEPTETPPLPTETPPPAAPSDTPAPTVPAGPTPLGGGAGRITFWSHESGLNRIFTVNPDGTGLGEIARGVWPDWSPDGQTLAFVVSQLEPTPDESLYVKYADQPQPTYLIRVPVEDNHLDWSPDGNYILFSDFSASGFEARALVALDPVTKEKTVLLDDGYTNLDANYSPDGQRIVFISNKTGDFEIYTMAADGSGAPLQIVFESGYDDRYPAWSPDSQQIVFSSNRTGLDQVYLMNADGTNLAQLTDNLAADRQPSWSLDGQHIVFASFRDGNLQIYLMDPNGENQTRLTTRYSFPNQNPVWQPAAP